LLPPKGGNCRATAGLPDDVDIQEAIFVFDAEDATVVAKIERGQSEWPDRHPYYARIVLSLHRRFQKICRACMRGVRMFLYIDVLVARRPVMEKVADNLDCSLLDRVTLTPISALCAHSDPSQFDPT